MDLTIKLDEVTLNIRVAILLKTTKGYVFEKGSSGYYFALGGRVQAGETSLEAARREVFEEIGYKLGDTTIIAIIENFYEQKGSRVQEICFVYESEVHEVLDFPNNFFQIEKKVLNDLDIRPEIIKKIIGGTKDRISHYIIS